MDNKIIDRIVWWIPFRQLRNDLRDLLYGIINHNNERLDLIENKINDLHDHFFEEDFYIRYPANPEYKVMQLIKYCNLYKCKILIETGTFYGYTSKICKDYFNKVYTIELSDYFYKMALETFKNDNNVTCLHGDSGIVLKDLMKNINEKTLFWLDGHYSAGLTAKGEKETPIIEELNTILNHNIKDHVLLIDDARCFGEGDYPTIKELEKFIRQYRPNCDFKVKNDIIRVIL